MRHFVYIIIVFMVLLGVITYQQYHINKITKDRDIYRQNTHGLLNGIEKLKTDSTDQAFQIQAMQLTIDEYKQYREDDAKTIKSLHLKIKNLSSVSKTNMEVKAPIISKIVHDTTIIVRNQSKVSLHNQFLKFDGIIKNDSLIASVNVPIQLMQVVHKIPKHRFLWWSWGVKGIKQVIYTTNPYVNINYSEYIELRK